MRRRVNWVLPGALGALFLLLLVPYTIAASGTMGLPYLMGRIIMFDYLIFFFGWIAAWNSAWRWRKQQTFVEELVTTNLRPAVVGNLLFAGSLSIWLRILVWVAVIDAALTTIVFAGHHLSMIETGPMGRGMGSYSQQATLLVMTVPVIIAQAFVITWFHLESLRIAYWMFATAALPRVNLLDKAILNFFMIGTYVFSLTALGSAVTGILGLIFAATIEVTSMNGGAGDPFSLHLPWAITSLVGLVIVGVLKRVITWQYEQNFWKNYLFFTWWGAGEISQPKLYSGAFHQSARTWMQFLQMEERRIAHGEETAPVEGFQPGASAAQGEKKSKGESDFSLQPPPQ